VKAARIHEFGDASVIRYEEVPRPVPGPGEVLIDVAAAAYNPSDAGFRAGVMQAVLPMELPYVPGAEVSGVVVEVGDGVRRFAVGDHVIGRLDTGAAAAEYVATGADVLVRAPVALPLSHAAALPIAALTAWQAVFEHARVRAGRRVLVNGAGGGVGGFAVQLAKHAGAYVIATAGARSAAAVRGYGADQIIDYTAGPVAAALDGQVDAVLNLAAMPPRAVAELVSLVRPGGVIVSITGPVEPSAETEVTAVYFVARNDPGQLAEIVRLVDAGALVVDVTESHPLSDLALVHRRSEAGLTRGKVIVIP
jgi:NADPH:quinone reductase-like Zn-dependent oxidoreductase